KGSSHYGLVSLPSNLTRDSLSNRFRILSEFSGLLPVETTFPGKEKPFVGVLTEPPLPTLLRFFPESAEENLEEAPRKASTKKAITYL
ncbi:MAG: hypothetical protein KAJ19_18010, partial [Gammaproteobacteria bacterium]|nr:hypothetical protein [Gammaproteobacteria bacterium]